MIQTPGCWSHDRPAGRGVGNPQIKSTHLQNNFSFQGIEEIPDDLKLLYKTVWEISQKTILKMAADRGAFIDQSQSLNIHIAEPNYGKLTSMHFFGWKQVSGGPSHPPPHRPPICPACADPPSLAPRHRA